MIYNNELYARFFSIKYLKGIILIDFAIDSDHDHMERDLFVVIRLPSPRVFALTNPLFAL